MNRRKNIIIGVMCVALIFMGTVFAIFQTQLNITGTGSVLGNWNIEITNITSVAKGEAYNIQQPIYSGTNATLYTGLKKPGDKMIYTITVTNNGNVDAIIDTVRIVNEKVEHTTYTVTGLQQDTKLPKKTSISFDIEVEFNSEMTYIPEDGTNSIGVHIVCVQDDGQTLTPEEPIITNAISPEQLQEIYEFTYFSSMVNAVNAVNDEEIKSMLTKDSDVFYRNMNNISPEQLVYNKGIFAVNFPIKDTELEKGCSSISSKEFDVSEARLESAIELKERFENQLEKLNEKSKGEN